VQKETWREDGNVRLKSDRVEEGCVGLERHMGAIDINVERAIKLRRGE
jgi:hypothetical protein